MGGGQRVDTYAETRGRETEVGGLAIGYRLLAMLDLTDYRLAYRRLGHQVESIPGLNHGSPGAKGKSTMSSLYEAKQFALDWIEQNRQRLSEFDLEIWRYAEPAWREYRSARAYVDLLRAEGFDVEEGSRRDADGLRRDLGQGAARCSAPTPNTTPCPATRSSPCPTRRRARGCTPGRPATPTRTRCSASARWPGSWPPRRRWSGTASTGTLKLFRRAGGEGLRLEAGPRRQGLLRRHRRLHLLPPA